MYYSSPACVNVKGSESKCYRIDGHMREFCIMPPWTSSSDEGESEDGEDRSEVF